MRWRGLGRKRRAFFAALDDNFSCEFIVLTTQDEWVGEGGRQRVSLRRFTKEVPRRMRFIYEAAAMSGR
jgi:hypothetical protein